MFGAIAHTVGIRGSFIAVGVVALVLALAATLHARRLPSSSSRARCARALADPAFLVGLWLNMLPALFFGVLDVLAPLALDARGLRCRRDRHRLPRRRLLETGLNPVLGRISDRRGRLLPIQWALAASVVVGDHARVCQGPLLIAGLAVAAAVSFGGFYTPGIALVSDRAEHAGLAQGLAFGVMNTAWAIGALLGPIVRWRARGRPGRRRALSGLLRSLRARPWSRSSAGRGAPRPVHERSPRRSSAGGEPLERPGGVERPAAVVRPLTSA